MCDCTVLLAAQLFQLLTVMDIRYVIWRMVSSLYYSDAIFESTTRGDQ